MTRNELIWAISEMTDDDRIAIGKHDAEQRATIERSTQEIARLREALNNH